MHTEFYEAISTVQHGRHEENYTWYRVDMKGAFHFLEKEEAEALQKYLHDQDGIETAISEIHRSADTAPLRKYTVRHLLKYELWAEPDYSLPFPVEGVVENDALPDIDREIAPQD